MKKAKVWAWLLAISMLASTAAPATVLAAENPVVEQQIQEAATVEEADGGEKEVPETEEEDSKTEEEISKTEEDSLKTEGEGQETEEEPDETTGETVEILETEEETEAVPALLDLDAEEGLENQVLSLDFEDNLTDESEANHQVTMGRGTEVYVDGVAGGKALSLDGTKYVRLGNEEDLQPENLTLSFWLKPNAAMTGEQVITWSKGAYNSDGWYLTSQDDEPLALSVGASSGQPYLVKVDGVTRDAFFPAGEWTHVAVTYDRDTKAVTFYRNGTACTSAVVYAAGNNGILGKTDAEKSIGWNGTVHHTTSLNAAIDKFELYNDVATQEEVAALYEEGTKAEEPEKTLLNQVLNLKFENNLEDSSNTNEGIVFKGTGYEYVQGIKEDSAALKLTGNTSVNLGKNVALQPENLTLSFWLKPNAAMTEEQVITWNKNEWNTDGWYLTAENDNTPLALSVGPELTGSKQPYKVSVTGMTRAEFFPTDEWTHVAVTYDKESKKVAFYRNGALCSSVINYQIAGDRTGVLGADAAMEKSIGYNGPKYNGAYLKAAIDEYQLYNDVATQEEVIALYEESGRTFDKKATAQADLDALVLPETVTANLALPTEGSRGSVITWQSDSEALTADGIVTRPALGEEDVTVTLTATAAYLDGEAVTKTYQVKVLAKQEIKVATSSIMGDVTLLDEYLVNAAAREDDYLLSLDAEKFLYEVYKLAGLTPTTEAGYGGWEKSTDSNFRGHAFGHYMSALSQAYLSSDNEETKAALKREIKEAVEGLKKCQDAYAALYPESAGWVSPFSEAWLRDKDGVNLVGAPKKGGDNLIVPYYNLHKILAGLIDVAENVEDQEIKETALGVAEGLGGYLYKRLITLHADKNRMLATEYGGMNEALYELYRITGNEQYKAVAEMFDETGLFNQLANHQDVLSGKHANTTIPKLTGALKRYMVLKELGEDCDEMYLRAAENFWEITVDHHTYVTGGNSQSEHFHDADKTGYDATKGEYDASLTCETCNTYNMLKLSKALYAATGEKKYMDYFENTYINAILSSQNPETGTTMYFQPMAPGYNKVFNRPFDEFWCCTGTGMENFSKLGDNIYQINEDGVSVHMFFSSVLKDEKHHLTLKQTAHMPNEDVVTFEVETADAGTVLRLRKPDWLAGEAEIKVNGSILTVEEKDGYYPVSVKAGDKITYKMPMKAVSYQMPDKPNLVAFKYGPMVLSAGLSTKNIEASNGNGILVRVGTFDPECQTVITVEAESPEQWLSRLPENLVRIEDGAKGQIQFQLKNVDSKSEALIYAPHYMRYKERYGIYMYLEEVDSQASQDRILEEKEKIRTEEMSVDSLYSFDDNNSEFAKNLKKEGNSGVGVFGGKTYRHVTGQGWFSYDLKIDPNAEKNYLNCTYYSGDAGRQFDLYINDKKLKTVTITKDAGSNVFYVDTDEIPAEYLTEGSDTITVKFQSIPGQGFVGGLFGISTSSSQAYDTDARLKELSFDTGSLKEDFDPDITEYILEVPEDTESLSFEASPMKESGLVYMGDILIDDKHPRAVVLDGDETVLTLTAKAQDHTTAKTYTVTIKRVETEEGGGSGNPDGGNGNPDGGNPGDESGNPGGGNGNPGGGSTGSTGSNSSSGSHNSGSHSSNVSTVNTVKTGDTASVELWLLLAVAAALGTAGVMAKKKRAGKKE